MLTLYHSPNSRSTSVLILLTELGALDQVEIRPVEIVRFDGSGRRDPANPHPEGKVPYLIHDGDRVRERAAIMLYLTDMFPAAGLGPLPGDPKRGEYLSWLFWYQGVVEPVLVLTMTGLTHPALQATFRDHDTMLARLDEVLTRQDWLLGDRYSAADLLIAGPFLYLGERARTTPAIAAWLRRVQSRPAFAQVAEIDG